MRLSLFIARRYLFSPKKQHAINIISTISIIGVMVGTIALIVVLSVFNGMDQLLQKSTSNFSPDLQISPMHGKFFEVDSTLRTFLTHHADIANFHEIIEEKALLKYGDNMTPVIVKGVTDAYTTDTHFKEHILIGDLILKYNEEYFALIGYGIATTLSIGSNPSTPLVFYYPNRTATANTAALNTVTAQAGALFSAQQEIEGQYVLADIELARKLFDVGSKITKIEIRLQKAEQSQQIKKELQILTKGLCRIEDKYELNRAFYAMIKSEKLAVFLILLFILLIASFNIIGSISMLILDKKEDLNTYKALGMPHRQVISIFQTEGNLITGFGALLGLIIGIGVCMIQEKFGLIRLGDGNYIVEAYPVKLVWEDILFILITVFSIGYIASYFPVKYLINKLSR